MKNTMTKGEIRHELAKAKKELKDAWICGEGYEYDQNFIVCYKDGTVLETREANERLPQTGIIGIQFFGTDAHYTVGYEMYNGEKVLIEDESEDACYRVEYLPLTSTEATAETVESVEETTVSETETVETEVAEKFIIYVSDDDLNVFCAKVFVGTVKELDDECDRIIAETNCEEYLHVLCYTDKRWEWVQKHYNQVSKSALSVVVRKTETAEQETELNAEVAQVEAEQTAETVESVEETTVSETVEETAEQTAEPETFSYEFNEIHKITISKRNNVYVEEFFEKMGGSYVKLGEEAWGCIEDIEEYYGIKINRNVQTDTEESESESEPTAENITVSGTNQDNINVLIVADVINTFEMITHTGYFDTS